MPPMVPGKMPPKRRVSTMADGDMGAPSDMETPSPGADPDNDSDVDFTPSPDMLDYHTGDENCGACQYMGGDGSCGVLKMPVGEADWCKAFTAKSGQDNSAAPGGSGNPGGVNPEMQPS
jgi:hypothetical protein